MRVRPNPGRFFWKLFAGNAILLAVVLAVSAWLLMREFDQFHREQLRDSLHAQAATLATVLGDRLDLAHATELNELAHQVGTRATDGVRVTFVLADGTVVGDSEAEVSTMESHANRVEIREALQNGWGASTRWSHTVSRELVYVAVRVGPAEAPRGTIRTAVAVRSIGEQTESIRKLAWMIAGVVLLAAIALALVLARLWSLPLRRITVIARRLARGDLSARARIGGSDELAVLAQSLNQMREHLGQHLTTIVTQRETLAAMLRQVREGVIVADGRGRIVMLNPQAARFLKLSLESDENGTKTYEGRSVEECVRNHELQRMLAPSGAPSRGALPAYKTVPLSVPSEDEARVELPGAAGSVTVLARATEVILPAAAGANGRSHQAPCENAGRLVVLTDISDLTKTIQMKTDFVANASHELRTPLSAIRGSVETVLGIDFSSDEKSAKRFIEMIKRQTARLEAMVEDLLNLSRVESAPESFKPETLDILTWGDRLSTQWAAAIRARNLNWDITIYDRLEFLLVNEQLFTLVIDNLVENAVKFTAPEGKISVAVRDAGSTVSVDVSDTGCGIPPDEQERVFERFYQVERSRAGRQTDDELDIRGTGLGLSIVRHAVSAMKGRVQLNSEVGRGTTVTVNIPHGDLVPLPDRPPISH